jgi:tetratricopeptide (TPR) repeat protein
VFCGETVGKTKDMAKKKKKRQGKSSSGSAPKVPSVKISQNLAKAESLMQRKKWDEAREVLVGLEKRYPNNVDVLSMLVNLSLDQNDMQKHQRYIERLARLEPDEPDILLGLAGSYLKNLRPALALRTFRRFLEKWPDHSRAKQAQQTVADLEANLETELSEYGMTGPDALDLAAMHEQVLSLLEQHELTRAREMGEKLLQRKPDFAPVLNNISQTYYVEGNIEKAMETSRRVLEIEPNNFHALSNTTRYLCLLGRPDKAQPWAERLKAVENDNEDLQPKQAEALSFLGDDQGVLDTFHDAERRGFPSQGQNATLLYHLAAVATMRQGDEARAKRLWKQALKVAPWFSLARNNLEDLRKPVSERHAPWPFSLAEWLNESRIRSMSDVVQRATRGKHAEQDQALTKNLRRWIKDQPEVAALVPMLLDRGDPAGREFALQVAVALDTPEMHQVLYDFARSQRGPDKDRNRAASVARDADLLPAGMMNMWLQGQWREVMIMGFEITDEPTYDYDSKIADLAAEASQALYDNKPDVAIELLPQAIEHKPDAPDLKNNLAVAYGMQGEGKKAEAMIRDIHQQHPDYLFAAVSVARMHVREGELDEAKALLDPFLSRKRFHSSEFISLCEVFIELLMARGETEGARAWLDLWEGVDPEHPRIVPWQVKLKSPKFVQKIVSRL